MPEEFLNTAPLRQPDFWPQAGPVTVIETHISKVFLVGDRAYKLKKPVNFGFVDFSTLKKRRHFYEEELRLNRRLAPDLYLSLRSITGTYAQPEWEGTGQPIEFVVEMRRFDQADLMAEAQKRGTLTCEHMDQLARVAAEFHQQCPISGSGETFGQPEEIARPVDENFQIFLQYKPSPEQEIRLLGLHKRTQDEWRLLKDKFIDRKGAGRIRECHGDMHLNNIILQMGRITIFDCIEFNQNLRWIDVLSEVAVCVIDLASRAREDLGYYLLNTYLEITGDYSGLAVLPYYLAYRAMVRAKVARLKLLDNPTEEKHREELATCLLLAEKNIYRRPPSLILMHGVSGTGKSYGAKEIVKKLGAIQIRSDVERKRLVLQRHKNELYTPEMSRKTYKRLHAAAEIGLQAGFSVVLDATYLLEAQRAEAFALADRLRVPCRLLNLTASRETLEERIQTRKARKTDASEADQAVLKEQLATREGLTQMERKRAIDLDTGYPGCWQKAIEEL